MRYGPRLRQLTVGRPTTLAILAAIETSVRACPRLGVRGRETFGTWARPIEQPRPETLQPPRIAEIDQLILVGCEHDQTIIHDLANCPTA